MQMQIELTEESRELLIRYFKESASLHEFSPALSKMNKPESLSIRSNAIYCGQRNCSRWPGIVVRRR